MLNKFETCYGCPDRSLTCRSGCPGWAAREAEKPERYARQEVHAANYNAYNPRKESILKRSGIKVAMR